MNPPSKLGEFPLREFHVVGHTTLDSNELRHGDHWYLYENVGKAASCRVNNLFKKHSKEIAESVEKNNELLAKLKRLNKGE